jgi:hypothetical protein
MRNTLHRAIFLEGEAHSALGKGESEGGEIPWGFLRFFEESNQDDQSCPGLLEFAW